MGAIGGGLASTVNIIEKPVLRQAKQMLDKAAEYEVSAEIDGAATNTSDKNFFNQNPPPESKNTIQSQLEAMANPRSTKNAVWIPEGSKTLDAIENQALPGLGSVE